tara:strand:+ start:9183 stop:10076 length:894 start_codon:yes stop_codon:yes gene_type:complete
MILVDLHQIVIASLMSQMGRVGLPSVDPNFVRHMVFNMLRSYNSKFREKYGKLVICCDGGNYWRGTIFPYYKGNRKKVSEVKGVVINWNEIFAAIDMVKSDIRENFPYKILQANSIEADDIIATLCKLQGNEVLDVGEKILIISTDKDFLQLQKYQNVDQWSPVRKVFLNENDPKKFLFEHILRGDSGDGIPNIKSDDDTFVNDTKRQGKLYQKRIDEIYRESLTNLDWYKTQFTDTEYRNWIRNIQLIDLDFVPEMFQTWISQEFEKEPKTKDRSKLMPFFAKHKMRQCLDNISDF